MYPVSTEYRAESLRPIREAPALAQISFGMFDATAPGDATLTLPPGQPWGGDKLLEDGGEGCYATFEPGFLRGDGKQLLLPHDVALTRPQRLVSQARAGPEGAFASPPEVRVKFGYPHSMVGLTLTFGELLEEAPGQITLTALRDVGQVGQWTVTKPPVVYQGELLLEQVDELAIRFDRAHGPYGRARLRRIQFGIGYQYGPKDIIGITDKHSTSPVSLELPSAALHFTLRNEDGRYDVDGDTALVRFLAEGQRVEVQYGFDLPSGPEWIPGGVWYLDEWSVDGAQAKFTASDRLDTLKKSTYEKGVYDWNLHSLYSLAEGVLQDAGLTEAEYYIDPYLKQHSISAPIPIGTHAAALQLIANLGRAQLSVDRQGRVSLETTVEADYTLTSTGPQAEYSDVATISRDGNVTYATFEHNSLRGDGVQLLLPNNPADRLPAGWVGGLLASASGRWAERMTVTLNYAAPTNVYSLQIDWGGPPPTKVWVTPKADGKWNPVGMWLYPQKQTERYDVAFAHCTAVFIEPTTGKPGHRPRIRRVKAGRLTNFRLSKAQIYDGMKASMLPALGKVTANWVWRSYYSTVDIEAASTKLTTNQGWARIEHDACYAPHAVVEQSGVTVEERNYAFVSYVRLSSPQSTEVGVKIVGKKLYEAQYPLVSANTAPGEELALESPLYDNARIQTTMDWVRDYFSRRKQYELEAQGFPELEAGDWVELWDGQEAQITAAELTYNGAFRHKLTVRK